MKEVKINPDECGIILGGNLYIIDKIKFNINKLCLLLVNSGERPILLPGNITVSSALADTKDILNLANLFCTDAFIPTYGATGNIFLFLDHNFAEILIQSWKNKLNLRMEYVDLKNIFSDNYRDQKKKINKFKRNYKKYIKEAKIKAIL